jgi:hypothetical protein
VKMTGAFRPQFPQGGLRTPKPLPLEWVLLAPHWWPPPPPSYTPPCCKRTLGAFTRPTLGLNHSRHSRHSTIAGTFRPKIAPGTATAAATATATATAAAADTATATATATGTASAATATTATTFIATHNWLRGPGQRAWLCQACVGLTLSSGGGGEGGDATTKAQPPPRPQQPRARPSPLAPADNVSCKLAENEKNAGSSVRG